MKLLVGWSRVTCLGLLVLSLGLTLIPTRSGNAHAQDFLRVGLAEDPDILDPTLARTFVGRIVFASLCDKLYDIDPHLNIANSDGLGKPPKPVNTPLAKDPRVREALELSLDRKVLNDVINNGEFVPACLPIPTVSTFYPKEVKCVERDVSKAKQLLAQAGVPTPMKLTLMATNAPDAIRTGEVIKAMATEAGFDITLNSVEFATALTLQDAGKSEAFLIAWSGRIDPDGNIYNFHTCGASQNVTSVCDTAIDDVLKQTRAVADSAQRAALYARVMDMQAPPERSLLTRRNIIYLWHGVNLVALHKKVTGFVAVPDGLLRLQGVKVGE